MRKAIPYLFVAALFLLMVCNNLLTRGMFMDGLIYTSIATNMAEGVGSFWHPSFTQTNCAEFFGHPPLMMGLLAMWFRLFGTGMLAAKSYAMLMVLLSAVGMVAVWRQLGFSLRTGWLPLLLCTLVSNWVLYSCNNFLESTMLVFVLAAVWFVLRGGWWHAAAGAMLFLAFLTKGPTGLFPLAMPLLLWAFGLQKGGFWRMVGRTALMAAVAVASVVVLCLAVPDASVYLQIYFQQQVLGGMAVRTHSRFYVVRTLFGRSAIVLVLAAVAAVAGLWAKRWHIGPGHWRTAGMLFALALCGCLPMMVSTKQYAHYLIADYPFVALSAAVLLEPAVRHWRRAAEGVVAAVATVLLLAAAVVLNAMHLGQPGRDKPLLADMELIAPHLDKGEVVSLPLAVAEAQQLHGYWYFYHRVSLDVLQTHRHLLTTRAAGTAGWGDGWRELPLPTSEYVLYERIE